MSWLIFDADDTLWENNIYFERAFDRFVDFLDHSALTSSQVREVLNEIELVNSKIHGYGTLNFGRNLQEAYRRLSEREIRSDDLDHVMALAEKILEQPLEVMPEVEETLKELRGRHDLTLFTKGHPEEQKLKVDRSGLRDYFSHLEIVKEKDAAAYRRLIEARGFDARQTWMIGNSPKSDINPALEAGLNAVFIPHAHTWVLEKQEIRPGLGRLLVVEEFRDLRQHL